MHTSTLSASHLLVAFGFIAALSLCCGFCVGADAPADFVARHLVIAPTTENPRNSEGSFVGLKDGTILLIYSHFTGGARDASPATLVARRSTDGGKSWDKTPVEVVSNEAKQNVMSVSLLRLKSGRIAFFYLVKNSSSDCRPYMRSSDDEAKTWSAPTLCVPTMGYYVVNNDRVIQLAGGRLIMPSSHHEFMTIGSKHRLGPGTAMTFLSDDEGKTWRAGKGQLTAPSTSKTGFQEPGVVELKDGAVMMWMRNDMGSQYRCVSTDGGDTWSTPQPSDLVSPVSPASIKRIPKTGDLMAIWNDHREIAPELKTKRTPLSAAISKDDGKTWSKSKTLESDPASLYCYTAILFRDDRVLIAHSGLNMTPFTVESFAIDALYH